MDVGQLEALLGIVREGSFSRAARSLGITQPSISARIATLEQEIGGALFVRGGRRIALTARGESFVPYAERALSVLREGVAAAQLAEAGQRGRMTLGTIETLAGGFLPRAIARFHRTHPQVEIFVRTGHSDQVIEMLHDGLVKLGLVTWPLTSLGLTSVLRFVEPLLLVASPAHPLARRRPVMLADVARDAAPLLVVRWGPLFSRLVLERLSAADQMEAPLATVRALLLHGMGAAFVPRASVADEMASGRLVAIPIVDLPPVHRETALVRLAGEHALPAAAAAFVATLRDEAGPICTSG